LLLVAFSLRFPARSENKKVDFWINFEFSRPRGNHPGCFWRLLFWGWKSSLGDFGHSFTTHLRCLCSKPLWKYFKKHVSLLRQ
jgi:hypothetical protein